jgi:hypothetical protein
MKIDPPVDRIRKARHAISVQCEHDPRKLVAYHMKYQEKYAMCNFNGFVQSSILRKNCIATYIIYYNNLLSYVFCQIVNHAAISPSSSRLSRPHNLFRRMPTV